MRILLDTHIVLWAAIEPERLGRWAEFLADHDRFISAATVWELAIKQGLGQVDLGMPVGTWAKRASDELALEVVNITADHSAAVEHLPPIHRDPFDRLLVAQAQCDGATLLTADQALVGYGRSVQWIGPAH